MKLHFLYHCQNNTLILFVSICNCLPVFVGNKKREDEDDISHEAYV